MIHLLKIIVIFALFPLTIFSQCECDYGGAFQNGDQCFIMNACSDPNANNYCNGDVYFNEICEYDFGCTCEFALNYDPFATVDDGNCIIMGGCSDIEATNYTNCSGDYYNENCIFGSWSRIKLTVDNSSGNKDFISASRDPGINKTLLLGL